MTSDPTRGHPGTAKPFDANTSGQRATGNQLSPAEERTWMVLAHLSAPIAAILTAGWLSLLGPLIVWALFKNRSAKVRQAAASAFNFNLAFWMLYLVGWILVFTVIGIPVALLIWAVIFVVSLVCHLIGVVRALNGEVYRYPFGIPILR
ncbi:DUF4870 domain-containing protein [Nakamurella aerolata]|uniref:DUF4870 domain-containing protein n=1 Tax=Nakamurella aerolata TaxID=1656892 RepID=A0A849ACB8_9ACTN|nr:DUF4870 domain-containing protein [Nakamurella aerolata]NNG34522.1 DUF4870 domain-containing protein [Nakamurella aerolata]